MSDRYEWIAAEYAGPQLVSPGHELGSNVADRFALLLGDPRATALVIEGTPMELRHFAERVALAAAAVWNQHCSVCLAPLVDTGYVLCEHCLLVAPPSLPRRRE